MELDGHGWPAAGESLFPGRAAVGARVRGAEEEARMKSKYEMGNRDKSLHVRWAWCEEIYTKVDNNTGSKTI